MKTVPFTKAQIEALKGTHPTPFYVYDVAGIRAQARKLIGAFSWNPGFKEFYAVKALPNPRILQILKEEGCGTDCSSLPEIVLSEIAGLSREEIMFTSNNTPIEEYKKARESGAIVNLDDIRHIEYIEKGDRLPELLSFRYNPGAAKEGNKIIGNPIEAKFGMTREQIIEAYKIAKAKVVKRFGLHTMVVSNELRADYFVDTARMLFALAIEAEDAAGVTIEFINLGGGIGIPYKPEDAEVDIAAVGRGVQEEYERVFATRAAKPTIYLECGRYITGPCGYLVTSVRHLKETYKKYAGLDATMANLMRPGMYGAYHHVTVLGKEQAPAATLYDLVGSLCENNDKFAIDRMLPELAPEDILVIHDAGAHGHAMGFNYNGKLRSAEFLMHLDKSFEMIRRAETIDDHFATLKF
jgi:diaminopimelate decarboxylase